MIVNNITINIEKQLEQEWLAWITKDIIPQVLDSALIKGHSRLKLLNEVEGQGVTYSFQFHYNNLEDYQASNPSPAIFLYQLHYELYKDRFVLFETLLQRQL